jgi:outer membrane biosynthesis protein TonB
VKLRFTRLGIAASAIGHLSALAAVLIYAEVHPFDPLAAEPIPVDIILPEEAAPVPKAPEPSPTPTVPLPDSFDLSSKSAPAVQPPPPAPPPPPQPAQQPKQQPKQTASSKQAAAPPPPAPSPSPSQVPAAPEPDLSIKYHVLLGLPNAEAGGFDAPDKTADIGAGPVAEFRRHLKTCSKLPPSVAPSDAIKIMLRVFMTPDGRLARAPVLVEASASAKGPALMQSATAALQACQPYAMLPADKYGEWKVLDLNFTPQDFTGG